MCSQSVCVDARTNQWSLYGHVMPCIKGWCTNKVPLLVLQFKEHSRVGITPSGFINNAGNTVLNNSANKKTLYFINES